MKDHTEREHVVEVIEHICAEPEVLAAVADGKQANTTIAAWREEVPRQDALDKVTIARC